MRNSGPASFKPRLYRRNIFPFFVVTAFVVVIAAAAQVILVDIGANPASLAGARLLIEAEVDPAVNARIVNVVSHLRELFVVEDHVRNARVRQSDVMASATEDFFGHVRAPRSSLTRAPTDNSGSKESQ